jgi:hypothetical protein
MTDQDKADLMDLMGRPGFRRFLYRAIQNAGLWSATTNGSDGRNLYLEGRRSLGLEILREVDEAQPVQFPDGIPGMTLMQLFSEAAQSSAPEKPNGRRNDHYRDLTDGDASS